MSYNKIKEKEIWILEDPGNYETQEKELKPGVYTVRDYGNIFSGMKLGFEILKSKDSLVNFTAGVIGEVMNKVESFLSEDTAKAYAYLKIAHKMGVILHGPPGTGKTCTSYLIMENMVKKYGAIAIDGTGYNLDFIKVVLKKLRNTQQNPIVVFYDEFECVAEGNDWLSFLDGNDSQDKFLFVACTNYIDKIPKRVKNRKSRIKHLFEVNSLPMAVYQDYVDNKLPDHTKEQRSELSFKAEEAGLTIDQFKHAIIDFYIEKTPIDTAIADAKAIKK